MKKSFVRKQNLMLLLFVLPALAFYLVFMLLPAFGGLLYSLTNWNGLNPHYKFVGLANYAEAFTQDGTFLNSLWFTCKYVIFMVIFQNAIAILLAALIESRKHARGVFRTIFFMPNMISMIIAGFMWMFIFTKVLPALTEKGILSFLNVTWIGDPNFSFLAIIIVSLWGGVGYLMIIYIAALQNVPMQLKEAAQIDGASSFQVFRHITLPMIMPAITICLFITLNGSFKVFDVVYALTGGGPGNATQVVALNIYQEAFALNNRYGYASAKAMILFAIIFVITVIQVTVMKHHEVES